MEVSKNDVDYGKGIVVSVIRQLAEQYGIKRFEVSNTQLMMQPALYFPGFKIVSELATPLFWLHFIEQNRKRLDNE
jgi:hypothetical protein